MSVSSSRGEVVVKIVVESSREVLDSVYKAFSPDNKVLPSHLSIVEGVSGNEYVLFIRSMFRSRCIDSIRQTVDEVLALLHTIDKCLRVLSRE